MGREFEAPRAKECVQGHTASKWENRDSGQGQQTLKAHTKSSCFCFVLFFSFLITPHCLSPGTRAMSAGTLGEMEAGGSGV